MAPEEQCCGRARRPIPRGARRGGEGGEDWRVWGRGERRIDSGDPPAHNGLIYTRESDLDPLGFRHQLVVGHSVSLVSFPLPHFPSAEMSQASPYLLSLGISKSQVALVLMAGPLSGMFGHATFSRTIRRPQPTPTRATAAVRDIRRELAAVFFHTGSDSHQSFSALLAVVSFYTLSVFNQLRDISINIVTVSNKCLIIDVLPSVEQPLANAYASRFSGISAILTMLISFLDLPKLFNTTTSQLKLITYIGSPVFVITHIVMCMTVHEEPCTTEVRRQGEEGGMLRMLKGTFEEFWGAWKALEGTIVRPLCWIELWAWLGWFPVIFYSTTWIGETWSGRGGESRPFVGGKEMAEPDGAKATRVGTVGLLVQAVLSLLGWLLIPKLVSNWRRLKYGEGRSDGGKTLVDLWAGSQLVFGGLLLLSPLCEQSVALSVLLIGACGIPWAITSWAPFTLIGEAMLEKSELQLVVPGEMNTFRLVESDAAASSPREEEQGIPLQRLGEEEEEEEEEEEQLLTEENGEGGRIDGELGSQLAGTVLGIHNVFIVLPQFLISFISSVLFKLLRHLPNSTTTAVSEIGWIFRLGGVASLVSGVFCWRLGRLIHKKRLQSCQ
ncbi:hypothetical protein VP01_880g2 [Puccinia sorghi]|uniref:Uncharacterized protein n=1 Tax=Puccinia sorghi TaxID=27349 RepID=A0A0L6UAI0_9BASI|nr:hypothetical protein VP01_880g2 [Puccinia sorghi]